MNNCKRSFSEADVGILNYTVDQVLNREKYLSDFTVKLYKGGVIRVGQLISHSERDLFKKFRTTRANQIRVKDCLSEFNLSLGSNVDHLPFARQSAFKPLG